jgi:NAD(P)-dependent dehydrogenase (short-subunit alcohol dehydrogenase family)
MGSRGQYKMKMLVTGGNRGLGKSLVEAFNADSISRSDNFDITKNVKAIAEKSIGYDIFVNNAFDGPPHESWANFGQVNVLFEVYQQWKAADKSGWIFNVGSVAEKRVKEPDPMFETYRTAKAALAHASHQCTAAFKNDLVRFKTTIITLDRLDTDLSRSRPNWTGNGINCQDVVNFINYTTTIATNTCIDEIILYVNFNSK